MIHKIIDGVPTQANIQADFQSTSFPSDLSRAVLPDGYVWVAPAAPPECGQFERIVPAEPAQIDGVWTQQWAIVPWAPEEIQTHLVAVIQQHLDAMARSRAYDGILSLCTYATSPGPKFAAEGEAGVAWRDACWRKGYEILGECLAGKRNIPAPEELIAELPEMVWPE